MSDNINSLNFNSEPNNQLFDEFKNDEVFKNFLDENFDAKSAALLHGVSINEQIIKITNRIEILNKELHNLIYDKYEDLLSHAANIKTLEDVLKVIDSKIQSLLNNLERLRAKLIDPHSRISLQVVLLNRLQLTCDLLRRVIRVLHLGKRLQQIKLDHTDQSQLTHTDLSQLTREVTKCAQCISEIELLFSEDPVLYNIEVIQNDHLLMKQTKNNLIQISNDMLTCGLQKQDQTHVVAALQVFYSLRLLNDKIDQIINGKLEYISKSVKDALDLNVLIQTKPQSVPGRVAIPMTISQNASFRSTLWSNIDSLLEKIYITFSQINLLYKILKKRRDPMTHALFIDSVNNINGINEFWSYATKSLSEQMCKAANDSSLLKQALEGEYPKLLNLFHELWKQIDHDDKEINAEKVLRASMQPFESAYLSRSLSLLFDSVNRVFADARESTITNSFVGTSGSFSNTSLAPSSQDIDTIVKTIYNEYSVSSFDPNLSKALSKNIVKTVNLFLVKCEQLVSVDGDATQVIGALTSSQRLNAAIVHRLELFKTSMNNLLISSNCNSDIMNSIKLSLNGIDVLMMNIMNPMINSVIDAIEAIILTMHSEDYSSSNSSNDAQCSLYMRELQSFIIRVSNDYFADLPDCDVIKSCFHKVANRTIDLFLRHTTLIRPLSNYGKMKIAADFAQLEMALGPLCQRIGELEKYNALKSFKPFLFQEAETIANSPLIGNLIPYSLVIQFLISSFGPTELKSPHVIMSWSLSRYTKWLDEHEGETERLELIRNSLETYVEHIKNTQGKSFAAIYPIVLELLQKGLQQIKVN